MLLIQGPKQGDREEPSSGKLGGDGAEPGLQEAKGCAGHTWI